MPHEGFHTATSLIVRLPGNVILEQLSYNQDGAGKVKIKAGPLVQASFATVQSNAKRVLQWHKEILMLNEPRPTGLDLEITYEIEVEADKVKLREKLKGVDLVEVEYRKATDDYVLQGFNDVEISWATWVLHLQIQQQFDEMVNLLRNQP